MVEREKKSESVRDGVAVDLRLGANMGVVRDWGMSSGDRKGDENTKTRGSVVIICILARKEF